MAGGWGRPDSRLRAGPGCGWVREKARRPQRRAVYLSDVEGLSYRSAADFMGAAVGTVMARILRGRRQLRGLPGPYAFEGRALPAV
ncbi:sigma factor-like helix-turn-helix DNA-binding protein [Streptomyces spinosirectus]